MAINSDTDIAIAIEKLGKKPESFGLTQSIPPHDITHWEGGDARPTDDQINQAYKDWKAQDQYKGKREDVYPSIQDQLDMQYWDKKNGTTTWVDAVAKVKSDNPKP